MAKKAPRISRITLISEHNLRRKLDDPGRTSGPKRAEVGVDLPALGMKVKATSITVYRVGDTSVSRHFEGGCEINGVPGYIYSVDVADNAEPGRATDTFRISLSSNYSASGRLAGGNIQLHKPCQ